MKRFEFITAGRNRYMLMESIIPYKENIETKLQNTNFNRNVFVMIKYRSENLDLRHYILETLKNAGFNGVIAISNDWVLTNDSIINPLAVLYCCKYGLAIFDEPEDNQYYNPNVAYELGIMHYQQKECLILIHKKIDARKPFDLLSKLHQTYEKELEVKKHIKSWVESIEKREAEISTRGKERVVVAIVKQTEINKFLITQRREIEDNLEWGFPAKRLKPGYDVKRAIISECQQETGITPKPIVKIGERIHPLTGKLVEYWFCEYSSGNLENKDPNELKEVKWMHGKEILNILSTNIFPPIIDILNDE